MRCFFAVMCLAAAPLVGCGAADAPVSSSGSPVPPVAGAGPVAADGPVDAGAAVAGYDRLLRERVNAAGGVDYAAIAADPAALDAYVASLGAAGPGADAPAAERLAHLMNAYNAFTLKLIVDGGLPESIMDLEGGKPWDAPRWNLAGQTVSLNQIEHVLIRPVFGEPRIHWALVCAAYSCPPLRAEAYDAARLEAQLAEQEALVLSFDQPRFAVREGGAVKLTPLFDWYGEDFGDPKAYAATRLGVDASDIAGFLDYDWSLNDTANLR